VREAFVRGAFVLDPKIRMISDPDINQERWWNPFLTISTSYTPRNRINMFPFTTKSLELFSRYGME